MSRPPAPLWRQPDFATLWLGQSVSSLGSRVTLFALPLTAVLELGASPAQLGALQAIQTAPFLLLSLFAGVWVDRLRRRPILLATNLALAATVGSIPLAAALGVLRLEQLYAAGFLLGALTVVFQLAYPAFVRTLVGPERLVDANGAGRASAAAASVLGPGLAGWLVQAFGPPMALLADAISYAFAFACIGLVRAPEPPSAAPTGQRLWREMGDALHFVLAQPVLRALSLGGLAWNLFGSASDVVYLPYLARDVALTPLMIGTMGVTLSVGGLAGALLASRLAARMGVGPALLAAQALTSIAWVGWLLLPPGAGASPTLAFIAFFGAIRLTGGFGFAALVATSSALQQALIPNAMQGRVAGSLVFIYASTVPLGALAAGLLAQRLGLRAAVAIIVAGFIATTLTQILSPVRHTRHLPAGAV